MSPPRSGPTAYPAVLTLGFAFGGFFDGLMLHQVLQWHHLMSLVPGEDFRRIETQIFWDGLFHLLMYGVAVLGLVLLWRARRSAGDPGGGRLMAAFLLGFGLWNVVDVVLFHWVLGIHRIRVDVPEAERLAWDLGWLALFGGAPLLLAWAVRRRGSAQGPPPVALAVLVVGAGLAGGLPPRDAPGRLVLFAPGVTSGQAMAAVAAVDGTVLAVGGEGRLLSIRLPEGSAGLRLYTMGALAVGGPASPAACLSWSRL